MKFRTWFCYIEVEYLFLIFSFICFFSEKIRECFKYFFMCYLFIFFHELSHIFVGILFGRNLEKISFTLSGVNAKFERKKYDLEESKSYLQNILIYFAGPISNIFLAFIFHNNKMIYDINICLGFINLIPVYPLDGYNILINVLGEGVNYKKLAVIENITLLILAVISICQVVYLKSFTFFMFTFYIFLIRNSEREYLKMAKNKEKVMLKNYFN